MKLYEINAALEELLEQVDPETGELMCDMEALEALSLARDERLENLALYVKNISAEARAIKAEEDALSERRKSMEKKAQRAKEFLDLQLAGEKFQTARVAVSYRKSEQVDVDTDFFLAAGNEEYFKVKPPEADKAAIKAAIKAGKAVPGASIVSKLNMQIK